MKILYLEDDANDAKFASLYFKTTAHQLHIVGTIDEAEAALASDEGFDVLLIDIMLWHARDGYTFIRALRDRGVDQPIVAVTALATPQDREIGLQSGATHILQKPFRVTELAKLIDTISASL